jgi:hypothetical protein
MLDEGHIDEMSLIHRRSLAPDLHRHVRLAFSTQFSVYERMFAKDFLKGKYTTVNMMPLTVAEHNFQNVSQFVEIIVRDEDKRHEMAKFLEKVWRIKGFAKELKVVVFMEVKASASFVAKTQDRLPSSAPKILNMATELSEESVSGIVKQFNSKRSNQILLTKNANAKLIGKEGGWGREVSSELCFLVWVAHVTTFSIIRVP